MASTPTGRPARNANIASTARWRAPPSPTASPEGLTADTGPNKRRVGPDIGGERTRRPQGRCAGTLREPLKRRSPAGSAGGEGQGQWAGPRSEVEQRVSGTVTPEGVALENPQR